MNTADTLLISAGSSDITPSRPMPLAGYANRRGLSTGINDPLELNAVMFRRAESVACVVSADLLFVTDELKSSVLDRANVPELAPGCLLFAASHTHFAPGVDSSKPLLGEAWPEYVELVTHRAAALIRALYAAPEEPGNVAYGVVPSRHNVNRRRRGWGREGRLQIRRRIIGAPNWNGPVDDRVHIVLVRVADVPRAILWSFACHPVAFHDRGLVSADFPGVVRNALRHRLGRDLPVIFLQGFSGDIRPRAIGTPRGMLARVVSALDGPRFRELRPLEYAAWTESLASEVVSGVSATRIVDVNLVQGKIERLGLDALLTGVAPTCTVSFQRLSLGHDLHIVGIGAEPVCAFAGMVGDALPGVTVPAGCVGSVFGYLPTTAVLAEGGYEGGGFLPAFGLKGATFRPDVEDVAQRAIQRVCSADAG